MYEFQYESVKPKYCEKSKLCFVDANSFIVYIKTDDIYENIAEDVKTRFDASNYELDRPVAKGNYEKVIGLMKDEIDDKTMKKFIGLRAKTYYLIS